MTCVSVGERISLIESIFGKGKTDRTKTNIAVKCPNCENNGKNVKHKRKLIIRVDNDICHCWVCGWKSRSVLPLIKRFGSRSQFEEYRESVSVCVNIDDQELSKIKRKLSLPYDFTLITKLSDKRRPSIIRYLSSRGLDWSDIALWNLGVSNIKEYKERIIVPSFDRFGKLNFIATRSYNKKINSHHNSDVERTTVIFNEFNIDWTKDVVLCEGPFDMFKCGRNSIPLLGCELSEDSATFDAILMNNPTIIIALDSDMKHKMIKLASLLSSYEITVKVIKVIDDPGSMSKKDIFELLNNARLWSWEQKINCKIESAFCDS